MESLQTKMDKLEKDFNLIISFQTDIVEPYRSWQRGLNEHMPERSDKYPWGTDGLIYEYIPKKN